MGNISVALDPEKRSAWHAQLLEMDGLKGIYEDPEAAYCPISLTSTPPALRPHIQGRQEALKSHVLAPAGITGYDPAQAPFSPDRDLTTGTRRVYTVDSGKIAGARFFVGHNILPSTGFGVELEKAARYNKMGVILMDRGIRVSRMQPHRMIYLQYNFFAEECERFGPVMELLQDYDPGMGFNGDIPCLLGFPKSGGPPIDLEEMVYDQFPELQYQFDGKVPILELRAENPGLFYENRST
ncbi:MAG: hypothetical protein ACOCWQ_04690 [Nanoarchaeota archaeon]